MPAQLLNGKSVSHTILSSLKSQVLKFQSQPICLAVVLVGEDPASHIYVRSKKKTCESIGIESKSFHFKENISESELIETIAHLNQDDAIQGILVQLPLPPHISSHNIIQNIHPSKDVDGFHPFNLGLLAQSKPRLRPCTPYGVMQLLLHYGIELKGLNAVVVGQSNIVGRPMALELLNSKCTVTICHSATKQLSHIVNQAELVIFATGKPDLVPLSSFHEQHIIVDVGIHRQANGTLRGDVDFEALAQRVSWITPVPGGVGPMTICTLMQNTLTAAKLQLNLR